MPFTHEPEQRTGVLSPDAEKVLDNREYYSVGSGVGAAIYNCDGDHVVNVSLTINATDLAALLRYGEREFDRGSACGRRRMQEALRSLINAAPLEPAS